MKQIAIGPLDALSPWILIALLSRDHTWRHYHIKRFLEETLKFPSTESFLAHNQLEH